MQATVICTSGWTVKGYIHTINTSHIGIKSGEHNYIIPWSIIKEYRREDAAYRS